MKKNTILLAKTLVVLFMPILVVIVGVTSFSLDEQKGVILLAIAIDWVFLVFIIKDLIAYVAEEYTESVGEKWNKQQQQKKKC